MSKFILEHRPYQDDAMLYVDKYIARPVDKKKPGVLVAPTGCHVKGHGILMQNGTIKKVENIKVNDLLIGPDSLPRKVLRLYKGFGKIYKIVPNNGRPFYVNEEHILHLQRTNLGIVSKKKGNCNQTYPSIVNISVKEYLSWAKSRKHLYKLVKSGINFSNNDMELSYYLGLWLGDGDSKGPSITNVDHEVIKYLQQLCKDLNLNFVYKDNIRCTITTKGAYSKNAYKNNKLLQLFYKYRLLFNKHIPHDYKISNKKCRFELLAGLIDSDGYYDVKKNKYCLAFANKELAEDAYFLVKSLGLRTALTYKESKCANCKDANKIRPTWVIYIGGNDVKYIPCKIARKRPVGNMTQRNSLRYGFTVEYAYEDNFYGFELSNDHLYLDEDFVVHHNSGKSVMIAKTIDLIPKDARIVVLQPTRELLIQNYKKYQAMGRFAAIYSAALKTKLVDRVTFATLGSVVNEKRLQSADFILIDECFPFDQQISTDQGNKKIGVIVKKFLRYKRRPRKCTIVPKILSYNEKTKGMEYKEILDARCTGIKPTVNLIFPGRRKITVTPNHPFLTDKGWVKASDLCIGSFVLSSSNRGLSYYPRLTLDQKQIIFGSILGDGSLDNKSNPINTGRIRIIHGIAQEKYLKWKAKMFHAKVEYVEKNGYAQTEAYRFTTPTFYFGENDFSKKVAIDNLTFRSLAISWMDDGSLAKDQNAGTLYSTAESFDLTYHLRKKLLSMGIDCKQCITNSSSTKKPVHYIHFTKAQVAILSKYIAPFIHKSMSYKIVNRYKKMVGKYKWNNNWGNYHGSVLVSKSKGPTTEVYNLTIKDNHTYVVTSKAYHSINKNRDVGFIVHNCDGYPAEGMLSTFLEHSTSYQMIGYTATPWRLHGQRFAPATNVMLNRSHKSPFGMFIYFIQIKDIYEKYWAKLRYESYAIDDSGLKLKPTGLDYTEESMRNVIQPKQQDVAEYIDSMPRSYKKGVVFMPDVASAYEFLPKIKTKKCFVVHGKTPSDVRKNYLLGWMHGGYDLAINVGVLGIGVDFPRLDYLIGFRPTNSLRLLYQFYGRLTRPHPEKDHALIVDFAGNAPKFGRIEDIHFKWIDKSGWNLFIGHKRLTGNTENWGNINPDMPFEDMLISFGTKAKGKRISETDPGYLKWIAEEFTGKHNEVFVRNVKIYLERLKQPSKYGII